MTNDELLNMFAGQAMQALLQKDGLAADKERICKNAWMVARMMLNTKVNYQSQSEKINVSDKRNVAVPDLTISDDNQIKVGNIVKVTRVNHYMYGNSGEVVDIAKNNICVAFYEGISVEVMWIDKDYLEVVG